MHTFLNYFQPETLVLPAMFFASWLCVATWDFGYKLAGMLVQKSKLKSHAVA